MSLVMPHLTLKRIVIGILSLTLIIGGGYYYLSRQTASKNTEQPITTTVTRGDIRSTVKVVGKAVLTDEQKLRFNQVGKVAVVGVKEGDRVKKDQLIASLDQTDALNSIKQSEANLANTRLNLQDLLNGSTQSSLLSSRNAVADTQNKIAVAEKNLTVAQQTETATIKDLDRQFTLAQDDVINKKNSLALAKKDLDQFTAAQTTTATGGSDNAYAETIANGVEKARSAVANIGTSLTTLNSILGIDSGTETLNDAFEANLGVLDSSSLTTAETSYQNARAKEIVAKNTYASLDVAAGATATNATTYLASVQVALSAGVQAADDSYAMLINSVSSSNFPQTSLDSYRSSAANARSSLQSQLTSINDALAEIRTLDDPRSKQNAYDSAAYNLATAEKTLANLEATLPAKKQSATLERVSAENNLDALKNTLAQQQAALADVERGPTKEAVAQAKNNVAIRELDLAQAKENLKTKYEIHAPFDGVVSTIDFKVGDNLVADDTKYVYIQNPDLVQLSISLDQIDVVKVKVGQSVEVVFDALPTQTFTGTIETVDPAPVESSGVVSYAATITINRGETQIFSGMTATANIITAEQKDVLLLSSAALSSTDGKTYVRKLVENKPVQTSVETGVTDSKKTEIKSGLAEGDVVVVGTSSTIESNSAKTTSTSSQSTMGQIMRATGGGGGGPPGM